jgi:hypothetical protein
MTYRTERIFVVSALVTVGLGLVLAITQGMVGTDSSQLSGLLWLMSLALVLVAAVGARWVSTLRETQGGTIVPEARFPLVELPLDIIIPSLMAAGAVLFLQMFESGALQVLIVLVAGLAFAGVLWAQAHSRNTADRYFALAQAALNLSSHLTAFLLLSVIYGLKARSLVSASAVGIVTALLLFELLSRDAAWHKAMSLPVEGRRGTIGLLSLAGGLVAGELTWGLNYWAALSALVGGAFLLVVFYVLHGLASNYVDRKLTRQILVEYGVVGAAGVAVVLASAFLS